MTNTLLYPLNELHYETYQPGDVAAALDETEKLAWQRIDALLAVADTERTVENTLLAFTRSTDEFDYVVLLVDHLASVLGEPWREAESLAGERAAKLASELMQHEGIYKALVALSTRSDYIASLPATHQKLLREQLREYRREGIDLSSEQKATLKELDAKLSNLSTAFSQNLVKANDTAGVHITELKELAGLSQEFIDTCQAAAAEKGITGYWLGYSEPIQVQVMTYCSHTPTRAAYYKMANTRSRATNTKIAQSILQLRKQRAMLLGYKNHAEYTLETRMVGKPQVAVDFIANLAAKYKAKSEQEYQQVLEFAREYELTPDLQIGLWEIDSGLNFYYANLLREKTCGFNEQAVSEYFPLDVVRDGMFEVLSSLYAITFTEAPASASTWHPDVEIYDIHDAAGHHLAQVRCDWLARKGKRGGAWMGEQFVANRSNGEFNGPHLGQVVCNFPGATKTKPSLLSLRDVETMWHEFGHFIHFALGRTHLEEQAMTACKWDFIEAPSQIMENWVWQPEILRKISKHYRTGEPLPQELVTKVLSSQNFRVGGIAMRQFNLATIDLSLHTTFDPDHDDLLEENKRIKAEFVPLPPEPFEAYITNFAHIFSGGYSAGYYGYKWAEAIQADLFSRFAHEGILNPAVGHTYADTILARGDEEEPQVLIRNFLGRDSTVDAMLQRDEII